MKKIILLALIYYVPTLSYGQMVSKTMLRLPDTGASTSYTNTFGEDNDFNLFTPFDTIRNASISSPLSVSSSMATGPLQMESRI